MNLKYLIIAPSLAVLLASSVAAQSLGWSLINAKIRSEFPDVKRITTANLAAWLNDPQRARPVLLDVRTQAEFDVSHLANAERVEPGAPATAVHYTKDQPLVTYCSVGYRSGAFAQKLQQAGYRHVVNLEGSIFRWANEERPLVHNGQPAQKVHPFNRLWGMLLEAKHRATDVPPADAQR
jgi:rhodanese-related sulfurtransferase